MNFFRVGFLICFSLIFILPKNVVRITAHLPEIADHYQLHLQEEKSINFLDFLLLHMNEEGHHPTSSQNHPPLPLAHNHSTEFQSLVFIGLSQEVFSIKPNSFENGQCVIPASTDWISSDYSQKVWQPPQLS